MSDTDKSPKVEKIDDGEAAGNKKSPAKKLQREIGGQAGPEPTRYGDWEKNGIISDF